MKIRLKNFRCYEDKIFDFGEKGLALLSGPSGEGKSTVLMGINFALFGTGIKVAKQGSVSCSVELEFDGMKIVRTKRPNRVVVNDIYEDQVAQDIINKKFGDTFDTTGYISQNALNSFIFMSPLDKLAFFEKFAMKDADLGKLKVRCKAYITDRHNILTGTISQLELAKNLFSELEEPKVIKFPINCKRETREKAIKNEEVKYKNCNIRIKRAQYNINTAKEELSDLRVFLASTSAKEENLKSLVDKLCALSLDKDNLSYSELSHYEERLSRLLSIKIITNLKKSFSENVEKLEDMKNKELEECQQKLKQIEDTLWKEHKKDEIEIIIEDTKSSLTDMKKVCSLEKELKNYIILNTIELEEKKNKLETYRNNNEDKKRLLEMLKVQKELFSCPSCFKKLRFKNDILHIAEEISIVDTEINIDTLKKEIDKIQKEIKILEKEIPDEENKIERYENIKSEIKKILSQYEERINVEELQDDLEYLKEYKMSQLSLETKKASIIEALENETFSSSYISFKKNVLKQKEELKKIENEIEEIDEPLTEEELRNLIRKQQQNKDKIKEIINRKNDLENEKIECNKILKRLKDNYLEKYSEIKSEERLLSIITENENNIIEYENNREKCEEILGKIREYQKYEEQNKIYLSHKKKVDDLVKKEIEDRNKYASATMLRDKILEAESIAMHNIILSVNTHSQLYLDSFFPDNPISIRLLPFKETKKATKPQINIEIEYKGMECDLNMLSGGELSRVVLAFTLALGEMFNTPLLLLDECTSSLDQNLTTVVFNAIRELYNGKLVILIAHQVVTGIFDKTISLGNEACH